MSLDRSASGIQTRIRPSQGEDDPETGVDHSQSCGTQGAQPFVRIPFINGQKLRDAHRISPLRKTTLSYRTMLKFLQRRVQRGVIPFVDRIELFRETVLLFQIRSHGSGVEFAPRDGFALGESVGLLEYCVWYGNRCFHEEKYDSGDTAGQRDDESLQEIHQKTRRLIPRGHVEGLSSWGIPGRSRTAS